MNKEVLSQDEINALLDSEDDENENNEEQESGAVAGVTLNDVEKDAIGEIGNISMGSAATALYSLLNQTVDITAPEVSLTTLNDLINEYERPCVLVDVEYVEGLEGLNILIIRQTDAAIISDLMMGGDGNDPDDEINDLHLSAISEAMNQMMGSASTSMSTIMQGDKVNISPPHSELLTLNSGEIENRKIDPDQPIVKVSFNLSIGDLIDSEIIQLMPVDFAKELVEYLMNPPSDEETTESDHATSAEETSGDEPTSNQMDDNSQQVNGNQQPQQKQTPVQNQQGQQRMEASKSGAVSRDESVNVQSVQFGQLGANGQNVEQNNISLIQDVPLQVTVRLGKTKMLIKDILELGNGSVIELDKLAGESVDLLVNGKLVAKGEVVVIDENFGFRVTDIVSPMERINNL
ncbi:flagellar motor switch phosphatase FliY [Selenihalanaerobacter shriftii]|uniref:Flagellar motor switch protein FliN/FliY n=1 Tax=Selenihalanaerobacter shriftii TaxID=142842 RepID=A0A1T4MBY5_9FIRM|nr:flagellar motor switch phosphatase FliY [Selenihalanaerobacter shriftii]SJZ64377.1 flagellar motor switch protein FliN/FliY [Selenihalanaerobacter shriftii]